MQFGAPLIRFVVRFWELETICLAALLDVESRRLLIKTLVLHFSGTRNGDNTRRRSLSFLIPASRAPFCPDRRSPSLPNAAYQPNTVFYADAKPVTSCFQPFTSTTLVAALAHTDDLLIRYERVCGVDRLASSAVTRDHVNPARAVGNNVLTKGQCEGQSSHG